MSTANTDIRSLPVKPLVGLAIVSMIAALLAVLTAQECHLNLERRHHLQASFAPSLAYGGITWIWWAGIVLALWILANRRPTALKPSMKMVLAHLGCACALAVVHLALVQYTISLASSRWPRWGQVYATYNAADIEHFGLNIVIYGFICGVCAVFHSRMQMQQAVVQKLEVERQLSQAQLQTLQMQMEPHFLFNTLNALTSLMVQGRNKEAISTLEHLDTILHTTLQRRAPEKVPFTEELCVIESYLAIQKVRFADRLQVKIEATPEALDGLVPCFLLQPIVENAIKHGIAPMEADGLIEASVKRVGDRLWMQVRDNGSSPPVSQIPGHGIGIQNIKDRLAYFYPNAYELIAAARTTGGYEVTIQIPYERALV